MMSISLLLFLTALVLVSDAGMPQSLRSILGKEGSNLDGNQSTQESDAKTDFLSAVEEARRNYAAGDFSKYMRATPVEVAECHVEHQVTVRQPGRCIKLGGQTPACQSKDFLNINFNECS